MSIAIPRPISRQRGFSLIEVSIVAAIILLAAIIGIPAIGNYVIENKVPEVGRELQRFVVRTKTNAQGAGTTPYAEVDTGTLANAVRDSSVLSVNGTGAAAVVAHGLGGAGTSGNGVITVSRCPSRRAAQGLALPSRSTASAMPPVPAWLRSCSAPPKSSPCKGWAVPSLSRTARPRRP